MMFSFHGQTALDPQRFAALSPAMQTEAVLMMADTGVSIPEARRATGLDFAALRAIARARPRLAVSVADRTEGATASVAPQKTGVRGLSDNGRKILSLLVAKGGQLRAGIRTIEDLTGIPPYGAPCQMKRLIEARLVEKLEAPHSTRATLWSVTAEGRRVLAACEAKDAANA